MVTWGEQHSHTQPLGGLPTARSPVTGNGHPGLCEIIPQITREYACCDSDANISWMHSQLSTWVGMWRRGRPASLLCRQSIALHWRHNDYDGVSNHQPHGCLLNRLITRRSKKTSKLRVIGLGVGNSPGPVNSQHKGPVTRKMFPFHDVIMEKPGNERGAHQSPPPDPYDDIKCRLTAF